MKEGDIEYKCCNWLQQQGAYTVKYHGNMYGNRGTPDRIGCYDGTMFLLEFKIPGKDATPLQRQEMRKWEAVGAKTAVIHSLEECREWFFNVFYREHGEG